jgi:importin subunit alpha-1
LASGSSDHVSVLIEKGTVNSLIELLSSMQIEVVEQAIWGLGNIAGDSHKVRDLVISAGAIQPIANLLQSSPPGTTFVRNASWTLSNLCRGRPAPDFNKVIPAIPTLVKILIENDVEDILTDICWALSYLTDGGEDRIPFILSTNVLPRLVQLLLHPNVSISVPSLRALGNIVTGEDS